MTSPSGILIIDKEAGWTSHDVVAKARGILGTTKIGHAGTLDPLATGVLVLGVGAGTKILQHLVGHDKVYDAEIILGAVSDTFDAEGEITKTNFVGEISRAEIEQVLPQFLGKIMQVPPKFSAIKIGGKSAHQLARRGKKVDLPARPVEIFDLQMEFDWPQVRLQVHCGSGTYIRSLAHDLGQALGCGAFLSGLRRVRSGNFTENNANKIGAVASENLLPLENALPDWPRVDLTTAEFRKIRCGQKIPNPENLPRALAFSENKLVALLRQASGEFQVERNF